MKNFNLISSPEMQIKTSEIIVSHTRLAEIKKYDSIKCLQLFKAMYIPHYSQ